MSTESTCLRTVLAALVMTTAATSFANNTPMASGAAPAEVAKATPIVAPVDATTAFILGTSERTPAASAAVTKSSDVGAFRFPAVAGHLRGYATSRISGTATYSEQPSLFDAAQMIPQVSYAGCARFDSSCRSVFTNVAAGDRPARVMIEEKSLGAVGPLLAAGAALSEADQRMLMHRVLAGREVAPNTFAPALGGVERSTVAVIPPSKLTNIPRPTMIYVGASDGMLHAMCGSVQTGVCDRIGRELWAYVPRSLLGSLRTGSAVVDGSPHVVEVMGDFNRDGVRELRTILVFTTGSTSSVHALDITNPADPKIAWEYAPTSRGVTGVAISSGRFHTNQGPKVFAYVPTSAGVTAIDVETGRVAWQHTSSTVGGVAVTNREGNGHEVVFGTQAGELWVLDAFTGENRHRGPAFRFSSAKPFGTTPALYTNNDGQTYALAVSTGETGTQYAIALSLATRPNPAPLDEESADSERLPMVMAFDEHGASRPVVMGKELAFATATKAYRVSFVTNSITTAPLASAVGLTSTSAGIFVAGTRSFGRVQLPSEAIAHSGAKVASDDDSEWY